MLDLKVNIYFIVKAECYLVFFVSYFEEFCSIYCLAYQICPKYKTFIVYTMHIHNTMNS